MNKQLLSISGGEYIFITSRLYIQIIIYTQLETFTTQAVIHQLTFYFESNNRSFWSAILPSYVGQKHHFNEPFEIDSYRNINNQRFKRTHWQGTAFIKRPPLLYENYRRQFNLQCCVYSMIHRCIISNNFLFFDAIYKSWCNIILYQWYNTILNYMMWYDTISYTIKVYHWRGQQDSSSNLWYVDEFI